MDLLSTTISDQELQYSLCIIIVNIYICITLRTLSDFIKSIKYIPTTLTKKTSYTTIIHLRRIFMIMMYYITT